MSFYLSQQAKNENQPHEKFWLTCEHRLIFVGYLKFFRFMTIMMMQTKWKLNNIELFLKLLYI